MKKEKETGRRGRIDKSIVKASMEVEKNEIERKKSLGHLSKLLEVSGRSHGTGETLNAHILISPSLFGYDRRKEKREAP